MISARNSKDTRHAISSLFAIALFALFAALMLLMVVISAQGYRKTVDRAESTSNLRTALGYVEGKALSYASEKGVRVEEVEGQDVLFLSLESLDGDLLDTAIYLYDGMLMEQFFNTAEMEFAIGDGQSLVPLQSFQVDLTDNLLTITIEEPNGQSGSLRVGIRAGQEAGV